MPLLERIDFKTAKTSDGDYETLIDHIERYFYAMKFVRNKKVLDAACGTGYGTRMLSWGAKEIAGADKDISFADKVDGVNYIQADFNKDELPECDVCVSLETIEHLEDPKFFLNNLKCDELIFSVPLKSKTKFHPTVFDDQGDVEFLLKFCSWNIAEVINQKGRYVYGRATR
jgi:SAM-dependent methyltransferase